MVAPILDKMAKEFEGKVRIAKVDTDANPALSQAFRIMSIPTIMAFKDGHLVFNQAGAFPEPVFRDLLQQLIALDVQAAIAQAAQEEADEE
jgi:thioredoxin-like negative regulator of GroEL